ncbi:hypothetical protein FDZ73_24225, partial [bacterium]
MKNTYPILEYDDDRSAILTPDPFRLNGREPVPSIGVLCFFYDVFASLVEKQEVKEIGSLRSEV